MEVRVRYIDGTVEAHSIPDYIGSSHTSDRDYGGSDTYNDIDGVHGIVERFTRDADGFWLEQSIIRPVDMRLKVDGSGLVNSYGTTTKRILVVSDASLGNVSMIDVDGEQVYPEGKPIPELDFDL